MGGVDITCVTLDRSNPAAVSAFWNDAVQWGGTAVSADGAICGPAGGGIYLKFARVPEGEAVKNRVHLGCGAGALDELDAELDRRLELGPEIAWDEQFSPTVSAQYRNVMLRDPEGNELCLGAGTAAIVSQPAASGSDLAGWTYE